MRNDKIRIRDLREDRELTQTQIAFILNTTQKVYSRYETGERALPIQHLESLADYYGVSTDYLLGRTDDPKPYPLSLYYYKPNQA